MKWEYIIIEVTREMCIITRSEEGEVKRYDIKRNFIVLMNELGSEGWEAYDSTGTSYFFKRQKQD